jgi:hypothetical protein
MEKLLNDPEILNPVRAFAQPSHYEGVGVVERLAGPDPPQG